MTIEPSRHTYTWDTVQTLYACRQACTHFVWSLKVCTIMFFSPSSSSSFFPSNRFSMKAVRSMLPHNTRFLWVGWKSIHRRAPLHTRCVCDTTERGGVAIERGTGILVETSIAFEPPSTRAEEKFKVSLFLLSYYLHVFLSPLSLLLAI